MFKKTITYKDFNDVEVTKDFYFHISKAELLSLSANGDEMVRRIQRIIASNDGKAIIEEFRAIIQLSCGIRSEDGSRFIKTPEAQSELFDSPAYDELLMELCTNADASANFIQEMIPEKMQQEMRKQLEKQKSADDAPDPFKQPEQADPRPAWMKEERNPTQKELRNMSADELRAAFQHRR